MIRLAIFAALVVGCTTMEPEKATTQLVVTVVTPADLGDLNDRLDGSGSGNPVTISVQAFDENNQPEDGAAGHSDYNNSLGVYTHYLSRYPHAVPHGLADRERADDARQIGQRLVQDPAGVWPDDDLGRRRQLAERGVRRRDVRDPVVPRSVHGGYPTAGQRRRDRRALRRPARQQERHDRRLAIRLGRRRARRHVGLRAGLHDRRRAVRAWPDAAVRADRLRLHGRVFVQRAA